MLYRVETTDPITRRDVGDIHNHPFIVEKGTHEQLTIYFESEETKRKYLEIPVEHPIEHRLNLDNPTDIMIDEGGKPDTMCHFEDDSSQWQEGTTDAKLTGELTDGTPIEGSETICVTLGY